jgi:uncharacterized protein YbjT (DUF2867 family)
VHTLTPMILMVGASGQLGRRVAHRLLQEGEALRVVSRTPEAVADLVSSGAQFVEGDLLDEGWMDGALEGVSEIVLSAQALFPPSRRNAPRLVEVQGPQRLLSRARALGAEPTVVHLSAFGAGPDAEGYFGLKFEMERWLSGSGLCWTSVRPTVFIENHLLVLVCEPLRSGRPVPFFGAGGTPLNWVSAADVAEVVVESLRRPAGGVVSVGGPDVMSRVEAMEVAAAVLGTVPRSRHLPLLPLRVTRSLARSLHPGLHAFLGVVLAEADGAGLPAPDHSVLDRVGRRTVREVVEDWARRPVGAPLQGGASRPRIPGS